MGRMRGEEEDMNGVSQTIIEKAEVIMRGMIVQYEKAVWRWWSLSGGGLCLSKLSISIKMMFQPR